MSKQKFSASEREAMWQAHAGKCAYTREILDLSSFHIDHIIPESLTDDPAELTRAKETLGLPSDFDICGYENLLPCRPGANLQKSALVLDPAHTHFFLGIAAGKKSEVEANLARIEKRTIRGKALILLQQCLERGDLTTSEVAAILRKHSEEPEEIFQLIEAMAFADATEVRSVAKEEIEALRDRPVRLGPNVNIDGVVLTNNRDEQRHVRTCRQYDAAIQEGYFAYSNFDIKMSTWFEHQCGLLKALKAATAPRTSYVASPRVGIVDLQLLPFSLFPRFGEGPNDSDAGATYQSKLGEGNLIIKAVSQNLLQIEEPEGMGQQLVEVARADFNGDGIEDILLFEYCFATHGTLGYGGIRILTRTSADGMFEPVSASDP